MARISSIDPSDATGQTKELLSATTAQLGRAPNLYRSMAQSPAALAGYLAFRAALVKGALSAKMRERIAVLTAAKNDCGYCVSAHSFRGTKVGLTEHELDDALQSESDDPRIAAALQFASSLIERRGLISEEDFLLVKSHGWSDQEIGEIVAHVALNVFANYFNHVAEPALDFPPPVVRRLK
jgi:uncharacterized peroxidase-related enzyme